MNPRPNKAYIAPVTHEIPVPHIPMPPAPEPVAIIPKKPKPTTPPKPVEDKPSEKLVSYVLQTAESPETLLEIYLTDGKGKFYSTAPEVVLTDIATGKEVKRFTRNVNATGNPEAQKVPSGTYNLSLPAKTSLVARNVPLAANKNNKLTIVVSGGSLHFAYEGKPNKPVSEFQATVTERIIGGNGATVAQKCDVDLEYNTGTYHIVINTVPTTQRYVDVELGNVTVITIDEPGFLQVTNTSPIGKVALYTPRNDNFLKFMDVVVSGNPDNSQKVRLQPGLYEARYSRNPNKPNAEEVKQRFTIKANETTQVEFK